MKIKWKTLIICIVIPIAVGGIAAMISMEGMKAFESMNQPPLSPPMWLFPVVWTILYVLMGISSYLVKTAAVDNDTITQALWIYGIQLLINFLWTIIFFNFQLYWFAFFWLIALWIAILVCLIRFAKINMTSGILLIPYLVWVAFAIYLNLAVAILN